MSLRNISSLPIINISKNLTADRLTIELTIINLHDHYVRRDDHVIWILSFGPMIFDQLTSFILCMFQYYHLIIYLSSHQIDE